MAEAPRLAAAHDLSVTLGAWINDQADFNAAELDRLVRDAAGSISTLCGDRIGLDDQCHAKAARTLDRAGAKLFGATFCLTAGTQLRISYTRKKSVPFMLNSARKKPPILPNRRFLIEAGKNAG
jgi:hypothetical protein